MINYFIAERVPTTVAGKYDIEVRRVYCPNNIKVGSAVFSIESGLISTLCAFPATWSQVEKQDSINAANLLMEVEKGTGEPAIRGTLAFADGIPNSVEKEETLLSKLKNSLDWILSPSFLDLAIKVAVTLSIIACLYNYGKLLFSF
jgi:hypothetical protein